MYPDAVVSCPCSLPRFRSAIICHCPFPRAAPHVFLAPVLHRQKNRPEFPAFRRKKVLQPGWVHLISTGCNDTIALEALEPRREHARREAGQRCLEVLKAARVVSKQVAQNKNGPPVTYDIECACNRAFEVVLPGHRVSSRAT